jgi:hypothetical protein
MNKADEEFWLSSITLSDNFAAEFSRSACPPEGLGEDSLDLFQSPAEEFYRDEDADKKRNQYRSSANGVQGKSKFVSHKVAKA